MILSNKVIFLDIDGVLNCSALNHTREFFNEIHNVGQKGQKLSLSRIKNLNHIVERTGADIVISSTWRKGYDIEDLKILLYDAGVIGNIIDYTPVLNFPGALRGNEIYLWIKNNIPYEEQDKFQYVILDDDSDMLYWQRNHLIIVDRECGLSQDAAYKATRILNG